MLVPYAAITTVVVTLTYLSSHSLHDAAVVAGAFVGSGGLTAACFHGQGWLVEKGYVKDCGGEDHGAGVTGV